MEKTITIDDKDITFKVNAYFPILFKSQFGYDILNKIMPVIGEVLQGLDDLVIDGNIDGITPSDIGDMLTNLYSLEYVDLLNLIWTFAKVADDTIPTPDKWYQEFDVFPIVDVLRELWDIVLPSLVTKKKPGELGIGKKKS